MRLSGLTARSVRVAPRLERAQPGKRTDQEVYQGFINPRLTQSALHDPREGFREPVHIHLLFIVVRRPEDPTSEAASLDQRREVLLLEGTLAQVQVSPQDCVVEPVPRTRHPPCRSYLNRAH